MQHQTPFQVASLVSTALSQTKLSGLSEMLKSIAQAVNAYGCILWRGADAPRDLLFVLAQWFQDGQTSDLHYLPLHESVTGRVVSDQKAISVPDINKPIAMPDSNKKQSVYNKDSFLLRAHIKTFCSAPISFLDGARGAVNLYRNTPEPFSETELAQTEQLASLVPALYQTIRDKVSISLIGKINDILHEAELQSTDDPLAKDKMKAVIGTICKLVNDSFQCIETSIFLEDRLEAPGIYELTATTWPRLESFKKNRYKKDGDSLTAWVLTHAQPVRIFDLVRFDRDQEEIDRKYRGLIWKDSLQIKSAVREFLKLESDDELPPVSFMAAPIVKGDSVRGVIRCSVTKEGPYYFADQELNLLTLVAAQISYYWSNWLSRREMQEENWSWQAFVQSIGKMNNFVNRELTREAPDECRIFAEALRVTSTVIKGAEISDVRLLDDKTQELYFAETQGELWNEGEQEKIQERKQRRFHINDKSAGAHVYQTGQVYRVRDVKKDPYFAGTFPGTKRMIIAPIKVEDKKYGVLDIRGIGERDFPKNAEAIAGLLGQQLGLYHYLTNTIGRLYTAEADLRNHVAALQDLQKEQTQTFQDLAHQLKSPINQAHARVQSILRDELVKMQSVLKDELIVDSLESNLLAVRGLCKKAKRVTMSTGLFADLARQKLITLKASRLQCDDLVKMLIEAAMDSQLMIDPRRYINFHVDRQSFDVLRSTEVNVDHDLLEQAVMNILDNAGKYSFSGAGVRIYGGLTRTGRFHISVANKGLQIRRTEAHLCLERGWRSEQAEWTTGEGTGIGLWIVDHIMKAHDGELVVVPTSSDGLTEVKLILPSRGEQ